MMPLYELAQDEEADPAARRKAAEALVVVGALRRKRVGPTRVFLWLVWLTFAIVAGATAESIGAGGAIALFVAGTVALVVYVRRAVRKERTSHAYVGPHGDTIQLAPER
jgi:membrane protein implicated in regulation of membrane protease activity